jgi:hypothetical protein
MKFCRVVSLSLALLTLPTRIHAFSATVGTSSSGSSHQSLAFVPRSKSALNMAGDATASFRSSFELPEDDDGSSSNVRRTSEINPVDLRENSLMNESRRKRLEREEEITRRFVSGDELHLLRQRVLSLRSHLQDAKERGDVTQVEKLSRAILDAQQKDAEFIYQVAMEKMEAATQAGFSKEADHYREEAMLARAALPQFNLEGLWVGKFGEEFQMVNVSYVGDTLVAHKVTSDKNVPKGEISFQVDLSPKGPTDMFEPIELNDESRRQWGLKYLQRHSGLGQVASEGFVDRKWLEGQLILVNKYFSFAWLPIDHQVFFGRPSPELTLKMLRESEYSFSHNTAFLPESKNKNNIDQMRAHLTRCLEETELIQDDLEVSDSLFKSNDQAFYFDQEGCFE